MLAATLLALTSLGSADLSSYGDDEAAASHPNSISQLVFEVREDGVQLEWFIQSRTLMEEPEVEFEGEDLWAMAPAEAAAAWPTIRPYLESGFTLRVNGEAWIPSFEEFSLESNGMTFKVSSFLPTTGKAKTLEVRIDHFFDGANPEHFVDLLVLGYDEEPQRWFMMFYKREASFPLPVDPDAAPPPAPFSTYFARGRDHVLGGVDHLAFLAALLFGVASLAGLLAAITAFTLSHSITLALGALDIWRLQPAWVEPGIALSISIALWWHWYRGPVRAHAWRLAFLFGFLHGSSFATQLLDLREDEVLPKLLGFNLGVELGQLLFVIPVVLLARACARLLGEERRQTGRDSAALLLAAFALVLFGGALDRYTELRISALPEALAPLPGALVLALALAAWAVHRQDARGRPLLPQIGGSIALAGLYSVGTWLGS
jgi:HupE/UreJ protein